MLAGFREHRGAARERVVSLVHGDEPRRRGDDGENRIARKKVAGGIVRIRDPGERGPFALDRGHDRGEVEGEVFPERHAHVTHARGHRRHAIDDEGRLEREHRGAGPGEGDGHHLQDLVGAVAEDDLERVVDAHGRAQLRLQCGAGRIGIAVDRHLREPARERLADLRRQAIGILHRVELHHALRGRRVIGGEREDLAAHEARGRFHFMRHSALNAWASRPSARASVAAALPRMSAASRDTPITLERFWKS